MREPIAASHGIALHTVVNTIDATGCFTYSYRLGHSLLAGDFVQIRATRVCV
ncbi:hypothetical protein SDC9_210183 [bioreactor metagenome]|uniref:Uncharacterized protein n=1 Tax=bioreactor metagenome TaxID=1076179 RepID=A0A645JFG5_9ZZZZ